MFGTKIRNWMEAQIARSRAKRRERKGPALAARPLEPRLLGARPDYNEILPALPISPASFKSREGFRAQQQQQPQQQEKPQQYGPAGSAVNLSSPESAYSTGYSTDGTSPCATYAPEQYARAQPLDSRTQTRPRRAPEALERPSHREGRPPRDHERERQQMYSASATRSRFLEGREYEHHPWRKPAPPTTSRPLGSSPRLQAGHLMRKPYSSPVVDCASPAPPSNYPLQLFSPRRMPLVATTSTQVMPAKSPRPQRSRVRSSPWQASARTAHPVGRAWPQAYERCCSRQESLSVGRSPVNRSDWRATAQLRQQQRLRARGRSASSNSSCSSRSRSCSISSASSSSSNASNSPSNATSQSSDDVTLNELMGKFDENYLYEKETDIVSDQSSAENNSSSVDLSSGASDGSSLDLGADGSSRSTSRHQRRSLTSGRKQRRRRHRRSVEARDHEEDEEEEHREEVELLQEVLNRRLKRNKSEASAQANRALLERLLMKNASSGLEGRPRGWLGQAPASRSLGGTPICLRRRAPRSAHVLSPPSRLLFDRSRQACPPEDTTSLRNISASELALLEADKEADLKYAQLIMEAERMLLNVQQQLEREESANNSRRGSSASFTCPVDNGSPSRFVPHRLQQGYTASAPNKRVELIKNAELNIELALSKSRNSQPELASGSIKDLLDHSSPKRLLQQQQKKMIEPVINQTIAPSQPENNFKVFHPIDMKPNPIARASNGPGVELSSTSEYYSCPQSEPVKRKVYEDQAAGRMLQYQAPPWLRNSDGDCASEDQQPQSASAASSYSQLRKHMLIETLQGLKQSLEDQSAALKMSCLRPL